MKCTDQFFQFQSFLIIFLRWCISRIGRKKTYRIITPVLQKLCSVYFPGIDCLVKGKDRHQFYCIDTQFFQIRNLFLQPREGSTMLHPGGGIFCKTANMKLIDYQIAHISGRLRHLTPVKGILYHSGSVVSFQLLSPGMFSDDCSCIRIQQNLFPIK